MTPYDLMPRASLIAFVVLASTACAPAENGSGDGSEQSADTSATEVQETAPESASEAAMVTNTGWLSVGADGSVLTTFLDTGGRYRDIRNGISAGAGSWEARTDGSICFTPDSGLGDCWSAGALDKDGSAIVTSASGKRVEIKRITYTAPPVEEEDAEAQTSLGETS